MGTCHLCPDGDVPDPELLEHLRVMHPRQYDEAEVERWPDGAVVVLDLTLRPDDFRG